MYIFALGGKERRRKTAFKWYMVPKRVVEVFFYDFSFFFGFLVFTVALLAWRVVFSFFWWALGWVGFGVHYTTWGESFALDWTTGTCYLFFIDEMAGGGMERGVVGIGRTGRVAASLTDAFLLENREPTEICHCWPWLFCFFVFMRLVW